LKGIYHNQKWFAMLKKLWFSRMIRIQCNCTIISQRRAILFNNTVKPFVDYFSQHDRLVTVDVTCGVADLIWHRVHQLLCDLEFKPHRTVNTVILYAFGKITLSLYVILNK
jgi:hypothetical protein